jgi:uracil-xanthine permease
MKSKSPFRWKLHGDGKKLKPGAVVAPDERLSWGKTTGIGLQHIVAMFGATFLVPLLTGFSPATTLFFSAIATMLFLLITRNKVPSYLGSSFAFIAPIIAAKSEGLGAAVFGVMATGILLAVIGLIVIKVGSAWINKLMPPVVTGTIVALIGFNLAPAAYSNFQVSPVTALVTLCSIVLIAAVFKGMIGRLSILIGVVIGYICAMFRGEIDFSAVSDAAWFGLPEFVTPTFTWGVLAMFLPVVLVLIVENIGHIKSVAAMTGKNLDRSIGPALLADGLGTTLAGAGGGSGTTTYAENIGVMATTRVYSTAAYWVAGIGALLLSLCPKFGAAVASVPGGVLGGATILLYGMIGMLGVRIWVENKVDFSKSINITTAAIPLVIGIANFTWVIGNSQLTGIAIGSVVALVIYHAIYYLMKWRKIKV